VVAPNEHQIDDARKLAREMGVDNIAFKTAQIYDYENGNPLIPKNEKYSRYRFQNGKYALKNKLLNHCWKVWQSAVVTWDGTIVPCCFDKDAKHPVGTLSSHSLKSIWQGPAYTNFRASLLKSRQEIDICRNCSEGTRVWE
jgi:radical SAM protein with 4Fe4S-binding SPASM domain